MAREGCAVPGEPTRVARTWLRLRACRRFPTPNNDPRYNQLAKSASLGVYTLKVRAVRKRGRPSVIHTTLITFSNGYLGSRDDEERSEMRYVMRIAERESSNL